MKAIKVEAALVCLMALLLPAVHAQGNATEARTTPDSFFYGLDVALDKISLLLTFDQAEKSMKALEIARERLLEVREMAAENKLDAMARAQREHDDMLETAASSLAKLERANSTEEIGAEIEIEKKLKEHKRKIAEVKGEVGIRIKVEGEVTPEQRALIGDILAKLTNTTERVEIEIESKKEKTKIKIKRETGKSEDEIENETAELEEAKGLTAMEREEARERIDDARGEIAEVVAILGGNATKPALLVQAEKHLEDAEIAFNRSDYGKASGLARAAEEIAGELKEKLEDGKKEAEKRLEIKAEIKKDKTDVEVEHGERGLEFTLNTTNRAEIVSAVAERTGLARGEIEAVIKFKEDGEHHQTFEVGNKTARMENESGGLEKEHEKEQEEERSDNRREEKRKGGERD